MHDVLTFLDAIGVLSPACPSWKRPESTALSGQAPHDFLQAFHAQRGDLRATLAALPKPTLDPPTR